MKSLPLTVLFLAGLLLPRGFGQPSPSNAPGAPRGNERGNVLVLLADDLGVDMVGVYEEGTNVPATPNIDALAARGVLFRNTWSNPVCSPTRATLVTGRYSFRTTIGELVRGTAGLPLSEFTLPELLDTRPDLGYSHAWIGKWHLGDPATGGLMATNLAGFSYYAGAQNGIHPSPVVPSQLAYYKWDKVTNGERSVSTTYNTIETVDDTLSWIASTDSPWVCYVAFCAPHTPIHEPPAELHTVELPEFCAHDAPQPYFNAMVQALDHEIGRLLEGLGDELAATTVIFLGDNGTTGQISRLPFAGNHAKGTLYEGGVNVPLIVAGPQVAHPGSECAALINTTDLYATVAELAGIDLEADMPEGITLDSISLTPYLAEPDMTGLRNHVFAEMFLPNGTAPTETRRAVRGEQYKLIVTHVDGKDDLMQLFDLFSDPFERHDLLRKFLPPRPPRLVEVLVRLNREMTELLASP